MSLGIFSSAGCLPAFRRRSGLDTRERLCYRHAAVFKDMKLTAFMNFHMGPYCFHQLLYLISLSALVSWWFKQLWVPPPDWTKSLHVKQEAPMFVSILYFVFITSPHRTLEYVKYIHLWCHLPQMWFRRRKQSWNGRICAMCNQSLNPEGILSARSTFESRQIH